MTVNKFAAVLLVALAACSGVDQRVAVPLVETDLRVRSSFPSFEMRLVSLPTYAGEEALNQQQADGTIAGGSSLLWADDPARAVTMALARHLAQISGAVVAPEPWPFDAYPAGRIDVRFTDLLAEASGEIYLSGQYFVVDTEGRGRDRAVLFDIREPIRAAGTAGGPADMAAARARAIASLAEDIAQNGL